ncbi:hypothetical protein GVO57_05980 [Sphingomonas changnyeongensis]|uniref:Uncharacterized protein n=1 Tax=Sphingomonas changnyeongensis TaxID=2698679 RepID=A0A7Z2S4V6_9SPHN|nr:hypothetical protein [Sphingomonas changnyeongensis]QHL90465.1 hypothetical protein GVO57_05980 [Sphingomonas changnyeongensis]
MQDPQNLLFVNVFAFSLLPLLMSLRLLGRLRERLDRATLRPPFYSQCFITAPVAMGIGLAVSLGRLGGIAMVAAGWALFAVVTGWYVRQQAHWFRAKLNVGSARAWWLAVSSTLSGAALLLVVMIVILIVLEGAPAGVAAVS